MEIVQELASDSPCFNRVIEIPFKNSEENEVVVINLDLFNPNLDPEDVEGEVSFVIGILEEQEVPLYFYNLFAVRLSLAMK